jgi:1-acyl-sn-glycerol-3-phosphate acyltransferase
VFSILIFLVKLPLVIFVLLTLLLFSLVKYILIVPVIIRVAERIMTWMLTKIILMVCSANHAERRVHPDHLSFDFIKAQKGELFVDDSSMYTSDKPQLILCNHINPLDFVYLGHHYCPLFTKVVMYKDAND